MWSATTRVFNTQTHRTARKRVPSYARRFSQRPAFTNVTRGNAARPRPQAIQEKPSNAETRAYSRDQPPGHDKHAESSSAALRRDALRQSPKLSREQAEEFDFQRNELINTSRASSMEGDHSQAIRTAHEAVEIACRLIYVDKDAFGLSLGQSLLALGNRLLAASEPQYALPIIRDTVDISRLIASRDFTDQANLQLVMALDQHGRALSMVGDFAGAIAAVSQASEILGVLSRTAAHLRPDYATLLQTQSMYCLHANQAPEAIEAAKLATSVARDVASSGDLPSLVRLSVGLNQLSNAYEASDELERAYDATEEAVSVAQIVGRDHWPSAMVDYDSFFTGICNRQWMLFKALHRSLRTNARLRCTSDALAECVHICRVAHGRWQDEEQQIRLAESLNNHAEALETRSKGVYALRAVEEATQVYASLARQSPRDYLGAYATSLLRRADLAAKHRTRDHALFTTCVMVYRQLRAVDPGSAVALALALGHLAEDLARSGRINDALNANVESLTLLRTTLPSLSVRQERVATLQTIQQRASLYAKLKKSGEAISIFSELKKLLESETNIRPPGFHLGYCLLSLGQIRYSQGEFKEAVISAQSALDAFTIALSSGYRKSVTFGIRCMRLNVKCFEAMNEVWPARFVRRDLWRSWRNLFPTPVRPSQSVRRRKLKPDSKSTPQKNPTPLLLRSPVPPVS